MNSNFRCSGKPEYPIGIPYRHSLLVFPIDISLCLKLLDRTPCISFYMYMILYM